MLMHIASLRVTRQVLKILRRTEVASGHKFD
jgi:hypothetical protein